MPASLAAVALYAEAQVLAAYIAFRCLVLNLLQDPIRKVVTLAILDDLAYICLELVAALLDIPIDLHNVPSLHQGIQHAAVFEARLVVDTVRRVLDHRA